MPTDQEAKSLCDRTKLFSPAELRELNDDLAALARARRNIPPSDELIGAI